MANTTKTKTTTKKAEPVVKTTSEETITKKKKPAVIDDSALINVRSNVFGELIYVDTLTKERISWETCGVIQQMPMVALRRMKTGSSKFFTNQLVVITGFADENADIFEVSDIYDSLYISQYYKDYLDPMNYDEICNWTPAEVKEKVSLMTLAAKQKLIVALNTYIEEGVLDSLRTIKAFEQELGCELSRPE